MNATDSKALCEYVHARWPDNTTSEDLWRDFRDRLLKHPPMPLDRAKEIVGEVRWNTKAYRSPDLPAIEKALGLEARRVAAAVSKQAEGIAAGRSAANDQPHDDAAYDAELRRWLAQRSDAELADLIDRCLRRQGSEARWIRMVKGVATFTREDLGKHLAVCVPLRSEWAGDFGHLPLGDERAAPIEAPVSFRTGEGVVV